MSTKQVLVRQLSEADAEAYRSLRLHLLQVSPDAYGSLYAEEIKRPVSHTAERLRARSRRHVNGTARTRGEDPP